AAKTMWQLDKRQRIMWVAWAARIGCFNVGYDHEPMFAGYVSDRESLWGAKSLLDAGAWWLPQLVTHNLLIPNDSLSVFGEECKTALASAEGLSLESGCQLQEVRQVLQNIIRVSGQARSNGGWVEIHSRWPPHPGISQVRVGAC